MRTRPAGSQDGFTLVELLAVLVVLALVAGLTATQLGTRHSSAALEAAANEIASRCRAVRAAAIMRAESHSVVIDMGSRVVTGGTDMPSFKIARTVSISFEGAAAEQHGKRIAGIRFFPNGASTGGRVRLEAERQAYEVRVNWLTGRVLVARVL